MDFKEILYVKDDGVATITLNRPEARNALNLTIREEILDAVNDVGQDESVKVLVMTGKGKAFCGGGDVKTMGGITAIGGRERLRSLHRIVRAIFNLEKPIIMGINGPAMGVGLSLALLGDIIIASEEARFACSFVKVALVPDCGLMYLLPRLIGLNKAKELFFTGKVVGAGEAEKMGLVNRVVPADELGSRGMEMAEELKNSPIKCIGMIKNLTHRGLSMDFDSFLESEAMAVGVAFQTKDHHEGIQAFIDKRPARFSNS